MSRDESSSPVAPGQARPRCWSWCDTCSVLTWWSCPSRPGSCSGAAFRGASRSRSGVRASVRSSSYSASSRRPRPGPTPPWSSAIGARWTGSRTGLAPRTSGVRWARRSRTSSCATTPSSICACPRPERVQPRQSARIESAVEAAAIDRSIADAWSTHPRRFVVDPTPQFLTKATTSWPFCAPSSPPAVELHLTSPEVGPRA